MADRLRNGVWYKLLLLICILSLAGGCGKDRDGEAVSDVGEIRQEKQGGRAGDRVTPNDLKSETADLIADALPAVSSVTISPRIAYPGTKLQAEVDVADLPGGAYASIEYKWFRNENELAWETWPELDTSNFSKGDFLFLEVVPVQDGRVGEPVRSQLVFLHNRPPEITSLPPSTVQNERYVYHVEAIDPDGDTLSFSLEEGPSGMRIDAVSGLLQWELPDIVNGNYPVRVVVDDGDATAFQSFNLRIQPQ